jgi:hypothetical protein
VVDVYRIFPSATLYTSTNEVLSYAYLDKDMGHERKNKTITRRLKSEKEDSLTPWTVFVLQLLLDEGKKFSLRNIVFELESKEWNKSSVYI